MTPALKTFYVEYICNKRDPGPPILPTVVGLLHDIPIRAPNLCHISINSGEDFKGYEQPIIDMLEDLPRIRNIYLPPEFLTPKFLGTLSTLPKLTELHWTNGLTFFVPEEPFEGVTLKDNAFPSLRSVTFCLPFSDTRTILLSSFSPPNLTSLSIESDQLEDASSFYELFRLIVVLYPSLSSLSVTSLNIGSDAELQDGDPTDSDSKTHAPGPISRQTLEPLLKFGTHLTSLEISHHLPTRVSQSDLESLIPHWPNLTSFSLVPEPSRRLLISEPVNSEAERAGTSPGSESEAEPAESGEARSEPPSTTLTLASLLPFALHCPKLQRLALFLDGTSLCPSLDPLHPSCGLATIPVFVSLKVLNLGASHIDSSPDLQERTAMYLSGVLPIEGCAVACPVSWLSHNGISEDVHDIVSKRCKLWGDISRIMKAFMKIRVEERLRLKLLAHSHNRWHL